MKHFSILLFLLTYISSFAQNTASSLIDQGVKLYDNGMYNAAIDKFNESFALDSNSLRLLGEMAMTYLALKDYSGAEFYAKKAITEFPGAKDLGNIYSIYGNSLDERKRTKEAIQIYEEGIAKFPDDHRLYYNKGVAESGAKDFYSARTSFQNAIRINPEHASSYYSLGILEHNFGNRIPEILALSRFMILEPGTKRALGILPFLTKKVNNLYYYEKTETVITTKSSALARTDTTEDSFSKVEEGVKFIAIMSTLPGFGKKEKDALEQFEYRQTAIFQNLKASKENKTGFYWEVLAPYFIEMEELHYVHTFTYYINCSDFSNKKVEKWIRKNQKAITRFLVWDKSYNWKPLK